MQRFPFFYAVFALILLFAVPCRADQLGGVEDAKALDTDDIEKVVDAPIKVAQQASKGVVWGKSNKTKEPEKVPAEKPLPQKTTVQRPVSSTADRLNKESELSGEKVLLASSRKRGAADLVETLLEVSGDVNEVDAEMKEATNKMEVVAGFRYEERLSQFSAAGSSLVSVRKYNLAKAKMKIGDVIKTPELDNELQTIVASLDGSKVALFSPNGSLRGEQLLLIEDLPGNTLTLDRLLPNKEVAVGDTWKISDSVLRSFLSVDAVTESNVEAVLTAVADKMAMVEVVGDVSGVYLGAATEMNIRAKYQFDMERQRINWLGLLIEEDRSVGHVGPGMNVVARLQVKVSPLDAPQSLTDDIVEGIDAKPNVQTLQLKYGGGKGPWRFSHDRSWYVFQDDVQATILRKLSKGELIAQCNIADMGKVDLKTMTTLDKFQKELSNGLGKNFGKVAAAEEKQNKAGYKVFTVLIDGTVDELNLRWIYNLLTDKDGQQAVVVFVVEEENLEAFGDADEVLLDTFRLGKK
ncbi:MAG: hypothetical protein LBN39_10245 [Planctomycetaceae bacterium]|nr:hypothetical protein [Planctomycetaceae bacterium]